MAGDGHQESVGERALKFGLVLFFFPVEYTRRRRGADGPSRAKASGATYNIGR